MWPSPTLLKPVAKRKLRMSKIAFLGAGNMAAAIIEGLIEKSPSDRASLICYSASGKTASALAERTGIESAKSLDDLLADAGLVQTGDGRQRPYQLQAGPLLLLEDWLSGLIQVWEGAPLPADTAQSTSP